MKRRALRALLPIGLILGYLTLTASPLWAQNENETVGFSATHLYEGGQFGENIDVLNGGLNLEYLVHGWPLRFEGALARWYFSLLQAPVLGGRRIRCRCQSE